MDLLATDRHGFVTTFGGNDRHIADYLIEEVLQHQPSDIRHFLLQTSILDRLSASLCDAVTNRRDSQSILDGLEKAKLFLVPLDHGRCYFRYHHLFSSLLQKQLRQQGFESIIELHRRASEWNEKAGFIEEAINHALQAGDQDRATDLVQHNAWLTNMHGEHVTFMNWVKMLGATAYTKPCVAG